MTEIGEGVATGGGRDPEHEGLRDDHWLELEYRYRSGRAVYGSFRATDGDGMLWTGRLNDQGQVCLAGLPEGDVSVELLPEATLEREIEASRDAIQRVLDDILADQREEAAAYDRELEQMGGPQRLFTHVQATGRGIWSGAVGLMEFVGNTLHKTGELLYYLSPLNLLGDTLRASYQSYQDGELTWEEWRDSVNRNLKEEQQKDIARLFGMDPEDLDKDRLREMMALVAEACDMAAFIADDEPTRAMLLEFAQDLADAQSSVEWAEFAGAGVFEIVLAALLAVFTGGSGNAARATTQLRHASRLKELGDEFRKLARLLRRQKRNKRIDAPVDHKTTTKTDQPDTIELNVRHSSGRRESGSSKAQTRADQEAYVLNKVGSDFKSSPLRQEYEKEVASLSKFEDQLRSDMSLSEKRKLAYEANSARRNLGIKYKDATPEPLRDYIYEVNEIRYGDPVGPTVEFLVDEKGKTYTDIVKSSANPNPDVDKLLSGFESWLKKQSDGYLIKHGPGPK